MTALETRNGLPDALRVLVTEYPREGWEAHPNFTDLTRFWLDRHIMFREVIKRLTAGAAARLEVTIDPQRHAKEVAQYSRFLLNELKMHHHIEDAHYFPQLMGLDAQVEPGFTILDADHHALDTHIDALGTATNAYLQRWSEPDAPAGALHTTLTSFDRFLDRHLTDEEELVVPVILKHAPALD
ncbi:MAG: hemerythrin domain-containing protein [Pseudomonadota bacterium]